MKVCAKCGRAKPLGQFHRSTRRGHQLWCKECRRTYDRAYFARNREKRRLQAKAHRRRLAEWNSEIKASTSCADCGCSFHPAAMEWDHLPGTEKVAEISDLVRAGKTLALREELQKCELVCANCHAVRSYVRRSGA
jgi:hypothetical protein